MRPQKNQLHAEHVLFGLFAIVLIVVLIIFSKDRKEDLYEVKGSNQITFETANFGNFKETPVNDIGQQSSSERTAMFGRLNQKMNHDLELRNIE